MKSPTRTLINLLSTVKLSNDPFSHTSVSQGLEICPPSPIANRRNSWPNTSALKKKPIIEIEKH